MKYLLYIFLIKLLLTGTYINAQEFSLGSEKQENALDELESRRLWPNPRSVSPAIYSLTRFLSRYCAEYRSLGVPYPDEKTKSKCAFPYIFDVQERLMVNLANLDYVNLPPNREWDSLFAGIVEPIYNFGEIRKEPIFLIANVILNQIAVEAGVSDALDAEGPIFQHIEYPAIMASLFPGERLTYYLRAAKLTDCKNKYYDCNRVGDRTEEETAILFNRLYVSINSTLSEIMKTTKQGFNFETWLLSRKSFNDVLNGIRKSSYSAHLHKEAMLNGTVLDQHKILAESLNEISLFHLSLPDSRVVKANLALLELSEVLNLLNSLGYPKTNFGQVISEDELRAYPYTNELMEKLDQLRNVFQI